MNCKNCNKPLPEGKSFCEFCGKTVYEMQMLEENEKNKKKSKKKSIIIACTAVVACVAVILTVVLLKNKNNDADRSDLEYDSEFSVAEGENNANDDLSAKVANPVEAPEESDYEEDTADEAPTAPGRLPYNEGDAFYKQESHDKYGNLVIERSYGDIPMGDKGTWTIFVYMCGSDLESGGSKGIDNGGAASADIDEMVESTISGNVRYIIETGGAKAWAKDYINPAATQRFLIEGGEVYYADDEKELPRANMGESKTLEEFVKWGVVNYPAEKMGLVFWNHGGGSTNGVCFDENYGGDSLNLSEINKALQNASTYMTDRFEFIGFDACLMGTIETADMCATYARYLYASEEVEPGWGWYYVGLGNYINKYPSADGGQVGKALCESYYNFYGAVDEKYHQSIQSRTTLSTINLDKVDYLTMSFDRYVGGLFEVTGEISALSDVSRNIESVDRYSPELGFNLVDLGGFVRAGDMYNPYASEVISALDDAVVAMNNGDNYSSSTGLSIYYPVHMESVGSIKDFAEVTPSPYYLAFIDRMLHGYYNGGDISDYDPGDLLDEYETGDDTGTDDYWDQYEEGDSEITGVEIVFEEEPQLTDKGYYGFQLSKETIDYVSRVDAIIYLCMDEGGYIELGETGFVNADWDEGVFVDAFDGTWFSLPDGSALCAYLVKEDATRATYSSPIYLNGTEAYLIFTYINADDDFVINGVCNNHEDSGMASHINSLYVGDEITPRYEYYDENGDYVKMVASKYTYEAEKDMEILITDLNDNTDYLYAFTIYDIFGGRTRTDYTRFRRENGKIVFYPN